jgi:hypothetical protein
MTGHDLISKLSELGPDLLKLPVRGLSICRHYEYARVAKEVTVAGADRNDKEYLEIIHPDEECYDADSVHKFILIG